MTAQPALGPNLTGDRPRLIRPLLSSAQFWVDFDPKTGWGENDNCTITAGEFQDINNRGLAGGTFTGAAGARPDVGTETVGPVSRRVAEFNGSSDVMVASAAKSTYRFLHDGTGSELFLAFMPNNAASGTSQYLFSDSLGNNTGFSVLLGAAGVLLVRVGSAGVQYALLNFGVVASSRMYVLRVSLDDNRSPELEGTLYLDDGSAVSQNAAAAVAPTAGDSNGSLALGATSVASLWTDVDLGHMSAFSSVLDTVSREKILEYLRQRSLGLYP